MLPLHLAFRVGARDSIMNLLIRSFPEALVTESQAGKKPYEIMQTDTRKEYTECVQHIVKFITQNAKSSQQKSSKEKTNEFKDAMDEQSEHVEELKIENRELEQELSDAKIDVAILKERCRMLERIIAENKLATVREPTTKTASANILGTKDIEKSLRQNRDPSPNSSVSDSLNDLSKFRRQHFVVANNLKPKEKQRDDYDEKSRKRFTGANKLKPVEKRAPMSQHGNTSAKSSVDPKPTQYYEEADICWNEIRQTICNSSEIVSRFQSKDACNSSEIVSRFQSKDVCNSSEIVTRFQTKDADKSVISSVNLNSVTDPKRPYDESSNISTNVANTLDTKDMESTAGLTTIESSINASATFATATSSLDPPEHKERDACWTEIREQISNVTDFPLKFDAIDAKDKLENNFEPSAMKESAKKLMTMIPKESETGLDKETIVRYLGKYKDHQPRKHAYRNSKMPDGEGLHAAGPEKQGKH